MVGNRLCKKARNSRSWGRISSLNQRESSTGPSRQGEAHEAVLAEVGFTSGAGPVSSKCAKSRFKASRNVANANSILRTGGIPRKNRGQRLSSTRFASGPIDAERRGPRKTPYTEEL